MAEVPEGLLKFARRPARPRVGQAKPGQTSQQLKPSFPAARNCWLRRKQACQQMPQLVESQAALRRPLPKASSRCRRSIAAELELLLAGQREALFRRLFQAARQGEQ